MTAQGASVNFETSEINTSFNSANLAAFLSGIYTIIYFGTIYIYFAKNSSKNHIVSMAITMLYLSSIVATATSWYTTKWQFVDNGSTRSSIFISLSEMPQWSYIVYNTSTAIVFVIADGFLIWRCFHVWSGSFRIISLPLLLITTETGLFMAYIASDIMYTKQTLPSLATAKIYTGVISAALLVSFFTTLVTTTLIAYRIYSASKNGGIPTARFKHVIDIVVQSGAVYALTLLVAAMSYLIPEPHLDASNACLAAFGAYMQAISYPIVGMLATIMVARVTLSAKTASPSTVVHLSDLRFHARSTHQTGTVEEMSEIHSFDVDRVSIVETKVL